MDIEELIILYKKEERCYTIEGPDGDNRYKLKQGSVTIDWHSSKTYLETIIGERCTKAVQAALGKPVEIPKPTFKPMYGPDSRYLQTALDDLEESFAMVREAFKIGKAKGYSPRDLDSALSAEVTIEALSDIL